MRNRVLQSSNCTRRRPGRLAFLFLVLVALLCPFGAAALLRPAPCLAAQEERVAAAHEERPAIESGHDLQQTASLFLTMLKAIGALALILGLIALITFGLRRLGWGKDLPGRGGSLIKVLDPHMLAPKKYVAVLQIADEFVAVSITDQQINLLTRLEPGEGLTTSLATRRAGAPSLGSFAAILGQARKSGHNDDSPQS